MYRVRNQSRRTTILHGKMSISKSSNYRILFCIDGLNAGGKERQLAELVTALVDGNFIKRDNILVLSMSPPRHFDATINKLGVNIVRLVRKVKWDPSVIFQLKKIVRNYNPNIVHSFSAMTSFYFCFIKKKRDVMFVDGSIRNANELNNLKEKFIYKLVYATADIVMANSFAGIKARRAPREKSYVLYNGFDLNRVSNIQPPIKVKQSLGIGSEKIIGMVARFYNGKDYVSFVVAAQKVLDKRNNVLFITIGAGNTLNSIKRLVSKEHKDKILFLGNIKDVESIINIFDMGVLLTNSNIHHEGISNSILEYMALEKPVIATDSGGTKEIIEDGVNGFLVKNGDIESAIHKIIMLLENEQLAKNFGQRGKEIVCEKFGNRLLARNLLNIYQSVK